MGSSIEQRMKFKVSLFVEQRTNFKVNSNHLGHVAPSVFGVFQVKNIFGEHLRCVIGEMIKNFELHHFKEQTMSCVLKHSSFGFV
jgi:hypothetical protein